MMVFRICIHLLLSSFKIFMIASPQFGVTKAYLPATGKLGEGKRYWTATVHISYTAYHIDSWS